MLNKDPCDLPLTGKNIIGPFDQRIHIFRFQGITNGQGCYLGELKLFGS